MKGFLVATKNLLTKDGAADIIFKHSENRMIYMRECWNGRQARLRCVCPMACEFESHLPHQKNHGSKCDKHGETWFFLFIHAKNVWCFVSWIPVWVLFGCYGLKNRESASYMDAKQQPAPALGAGFSASMGLCAAGSRRLLCK